MLCALGLLGLAYGAEATHHHDSDVESAQCVVCHWHDQRLEPPTVPTVDPEPPVRVSRADEAVPPRSRTHVRTLPPATGPPASH